MEQLWTKTAIIFGVVACVYFGAHIINAVVLP